MNYRHAFHAGNFADVLKHAVLALVIEHMKLKPAPFRIIDTHAGLGRYDLEADEAERTGEWRDGIGRILAAEPPADIAEILKPYLDVVAEGISDASTRNLRTYPGSPLLSRRLMRRADRLVVNELHPEDREQLAELFSGDPQTKVLSLDGWAVLKSLLPPKERRGVVLVDPPFEQPGEFARLARGLRDAVERFATGTVMLWYPAKDPRAVAAFHHELTGLRLPKLIAVELSVRAPSQDAGLGATGLVILNAPYTLSSKLQVLMPWLSAMLMQDEGGGWRMLNLGTEVI